MHIQKRAPSAVQRTDWKAPRERMRTRRETMPWSRGCLLGGVALKVSSEVGEAPER